MRHYTDIAVYGSDGELKLLVEVKSKKGASASWAARLRRNMYAHGQLPRAPYILLALPDKFYLWRGVQDPNAEINPDYEADPSLLLRPYAGSAGDDLSTLNERSLELVIASWLEKLVSGFNLPEPPPSVQWLRNSGLLEAIRGGRSEVQALV
jgi:hypothetical protein